MYKIILKGKFKFVGDFHTMVGGSTLFYSAPTKKSRKISKVLAYKLKHNYAPSPNKGTITRTAASHGLYSFTAEVQSKKGGVSPGRDRLAYKQMLTFLKYVKSVK
jgi:predicted deacylase